MPSEKAGSLGSILKGVISGLSKKKLAEDRLRRAWRSAVGKKGASHTRLAAVRKSKLIVNVNDSGWLYELTLKKKKLIKKLEEKIEGKKIKDIRFRIGDI